MNINKPLKNLEVCCTVPESSRQALKLLVLVPTSCPSPLVSGKVSPKASEGFKTIKMKKWNALGNKDFFGRARKPRMGCFYF